MSYVDGEKIEKLISIAKSCNLSVDENGLRDLVGHDDDPHEADDRIGLLLADRNRAAHFHHSVSYMGEKEQSFLDLIEAALKMLGVNPVESKSDYIDSSDSEEIEIHVGDEQHLFTFRYGYSSDSELLEAVSTIAAKHSDREIVEIHGPDQSYVLIVPATLATFLDETFIHMSKV